MIQKGFVIFLCGLFFGTLTAQAVVPSYWGKGINPKKYEAFQARKEALKSKNALRFKHVEKDSLTLVVAAHPDDEILCCSNTIRSLVENGESVVIVFLTDGDAKAFNNPRVSKQYGITRRKESKEAAQVLGLGREDLIFLNFPDGLLSILGEEPLKSPYTYQVRTGPGAYFPNISYTKQALQEKLLALVTQLNPTTVYIPSEIKDKHPDHRFAGEIMKEVLKAPALYDSDRTVYEYFVHGKKVDRAVAIPDPQKLSLIRLFQSQMHDLAHEEFLENFAYVQETFTEWRQRLLSQAQAK